MVIQKMFSYYYTNHFLWFRIFGYGLKIKHIDYHPLRFAAWRSCRTESLIEKQNGNFANTVLGAVPSVVYNEDCVEGLKRFPDNYFDLAIVDPPYSETFNTDACADNKGKKGSYKLDTLNNHLPTEEYWNELFRVSKNQIVWGANWYGKYFGVGGLVWFKDNTGNYSPCEYAYQSINNHIHHYQYRWNGMLQQNMKQKEERIHPTQKPVALYDWILQKFAKQGDLILDTHGGSMSSVIACLKGGYNITCFEIDREYYNKGKKRIEAFISQGDLFMEKPEINFIDTCSTK